MLVMLKRAWIALVVAMVVALGSVAVVRLRGVFGSDAIFSATATQAEPLPQVNLKRVTYEVLGPSGTSGRVSYLNIQSQSEHADFSDLPWTHTITTTNSSVIADVVAQGDSNDLGCRIKVNGEVKDEHHSSEHHAQTSCLVKAA
jgi:Mycobacterium membrane protein